MTKRKFNCPAELTLTLIGGKWKAILLYNLRRGPLRFGELKRLSPGISPAVLSAELKELEASGLAHRAILGPDRLSGVEYALTEKGETLRPVINALIRWGIAHQREHALGEFGMAKFQK